MPGLPKNTFQVVQEGREGKQEITKKRIYTNGEVTSEEQVSIKITKGSVDKIVEIGTANYTNNYNAKVGDTIYVTADRLAVMTEPNENAQKILTLNKGRQLKILEIQENWYKISCDGVVGYIKSESTTNLNANKKEEKQTNITQKDGSELNLKLDFNMALNQPSGLSLEQFKKVLTDERDVNKIFENNAQYFYYIEQQ